MAENTGISWAHNTQNFWVGCVTSALLNAPLVVAGHLRRRYESRKSN